MNNEIYLELTSKQLSLKNNNDLLGTYPVAIGKPSTPTPTGNFKILNKINNPGGALGTRWMQFTRQNHGIHGTNKPWLIGKAVSHGCVRMYNNDVEKIYSQVTIGTSVIIRQIFTDRRQPQTDKFKKKDPQDPNNSYITYTIRKGDSLWKISRQYNLSISKIKAINNLKGNTIYPGQKLKIPINT